MSAGFPTDPRDMCRLSNEAERSLAMVTAPPTFDMGGVYDVTLHPPRSWRGARGAARSRTVRSKPLQDLWKSDGDRGAISAILALGMTILLGSAALAIDLGHLMNVRTESQRVADLAALAGAGAFVNANGPLVATTADQWAKDFAALNTVNKTSVVLQSADIQVDIPNERVRVTVYNTQTRGNAIGTIFARVLGINQVDVVTTAVAQAWPAGGVKCILPLFLVDKWDELGGNPLQYDPGIDYYEAYAPASPSPTATGYSQGPPPPADIGTEIVIKPANGPPSSSGRPNPSWYYPFDASDVPGGANFRDAIAHCTDTNFIYTWGQLLTVEPGAMIGPTKAGFQDLIAQDPNAVWDHDPNVNCIVDASQLGSGNPANCRGSPRLRPVPMMDPNDTPASGKKTVPIHNFGGVFVDRVQGNDVYVVFAGYTGVIPASNPGGPVNPLPKVLRLIE